MLNNPIKPNNNKNSHNGDDNNRKKKWIVYLSGILTFIIAFFAFYNGGVFFAKQESAEKTYVEFAELVEQNGVIEYVDYDSGHKFINFKVVDDETIYTAPNPKYQNFKKDLLEKGITVNEVDIKESFMDGTLGSILMMVVQYGLLFGMFALVFKKFMPGASESEIDIQTQSTNKFSDVAGLEEVKESLLITVDMLKDPKKYEAAGAKIPKGALLYGPPGTGKTLLAKAIAGEAGVNFLATSGADFDNKYVGVGADKVRKLFAKAKKSAPCILFIDELDAIGTKRSGTDKSFERQTLNQLLACMDGFTTRDGIFIFAATNDINSLDPALLRPGRFDSRFAVGLPDTARDRIAIIRLYMKNKKFDETVSFESLAKQTLGCSPAAIEAMINEAAIESVKNGGIINQQNIDEAFYRQIMDGHRKKNSDRNESEIKTVAWHEAGHAVAGYLQHQEVSKISIVPTTSGTGGVTIFNQKKLGLYSKEELEAHVRTLYAGRNAEIMLNGQEKVTTGASNDISEATKCIKQMVNAYGMSKYGLLNLSELDISTSDLMDEYQKISKRLEEESAKLLEDNRSLLECLSNILIEKETLDENELIEIFLSFKNTEEVKN